MEVRMGLHLSNQLQYCIQPWGPPDMKLDQVQENDERTEHTAYEDRLRELGLSTVGNRRLLRNLLVAFQY